MMKRLPTALVLILLAFAIAAPTVSASATGQSFVLHLDCADGTETDIRVPSGGSYAGLLQDSTRVGVLKGIDLDRDGVPEFLVPGFEVGDLTACAAFSEGIFVFIAYVLFIPRGG